MPSTFGACTVMSGKASSRKNTSDKSERPGRNSRPVARARASASTPRFIYASRVRRRPHRVPGNHRRERARLWCMAHVTSATRPASRSAYASGRRRPAFGPDRLAQCPSRPAHSELRAWLVRVRRGRADVNNDGRIGGGIRPFVPPPISNSPPTGDFVLPELTEPPLHPMMPARRPRREGRVRQCVAALSHSGWELPAIRLPRAFDRAEYPANSTSTRWRRQ